MNAAALAALIAAVFWALLVCVGVVVLLRLGRLLSASTALVSDVRERTDVLLQRAQAAVDGAQAAVDRAGQQLGRTESVTASMDELGAGMAELAALVRGDELAPGGDPPGSPRSWGEAFPPKPPRPPWGRTAALAYGVRHAVGLRRAGRRTLPGRVVERGQLARGGKAAR